LLNGRIVGEKTRLKHEDTIQVGETALTFTIVQGSILVDEEL
jgi:predicted transcriptional regulator